MQKFSMTLLGLLFFAGCSSESMSRFPSEQIVPTTSHQDLTVVSVKQMQMMLLMHRSNMSSIFARFRIPVRTNSVDPSFDSHSGLYRGLDGSTFAPPPDEFVQRDSVADSRIRDTSSCTSTKWSGVAPPSCDGTGPFRRAYSPGSFSGVDVEVTTPSTNPGMPYGPNPVNGDTGYIYIEAWPGVNASNSEYGFQYSVGTSKITNNWYTQYMSSNGHQENSNTASTSFQAGHTLEVDVGEYNPPPGSLPVGNCTIAPCFLGEAVDLSDSNCASAYDCGDSLAMNNASYVENCCYWARMTTIGQTNTNVFTDGSKFGGVIWDQAVLFTDQSTQSNPGMFTYYTWTNGGDQDWPNDTSKIIVTNYDVSDETDTINLHP